MSETNENCSGWARRESDGRLVHVNDVPNGRDCGCLCPDCGSSLIARQGESRIWHFAHAPKEDCGSSGETALHLAAKQTLKDLRGQIDLPEEVIRKIGWPTPNERVSKPMAKLNDQMTQIIPERRLSASNVRIEPQDWADHGFRPDAVLEKDGNALLIEIRVTHEVEEEKRRRMQRVGLGAIEIDLSETERNTTPNDLESLLVSKAPRQWLVTGRKKMRKEWEAEFAKRLETEASRMNGMVPRELTKDFYVNACPRRNEPGFESVYVLQCMDCNFYGGHLNTLENTPLWNMLDEKLVHAHHNSVLCTHKSCSRNLPTEEQKKYVGDLVGNDLRREGGLTACLPNDWEKDKAFCSAFIAAHPNCRKCDRKMVLRRNRHEGFFWACCNFPICKGGSSFRGQSPLDEIVNLHERKRREDQEESEKKAAKRAALARPKAGRNSLSRLATPSAHRSSKS